MKAGCFICVAVTCASTLFSGCTGDPEALMRKFTPPEDERVATNYISAIRHGNFGPVVKDIDPSLKESLTTNLLVKMAGIFPAGEPVSTKIVGAHQFINPDSYQINLAFEYQFPSNWIVVNVATQKKDGVSTIIGLHVLEYSDSLENLNRFTMEGKRPLQFAALALAISMPLFMISTLIICICTRIEKMKWVWVILIMLGICRFTVNWTTGKGHFWPLQVVFLGAAALQVPYGPWMISFSAPVGAILFLVKRRKLSAPVSEVQPEPTEIAN